MNEFEANEKRLDITEDLRSWVYEVKYEKANGDLRTATATLHADFLPEVSMTFEEIQKEIDEGKRRRRKHNPYVVHYYDLEAEAWRSFRVDRFVGMSAVEQSVYDTFKK